MELAMLIRPSDQILISVFFSEKQLCFGFCITREDTSCIRKPSFILIMDSKRKEGDIRVEGLRRGPFVGVGGTERGPDKLVFLLEIERLLHHAPILRLRLPSRAVSLSCSPDYPTRRRDYLKVRRPLP